ncbi:MAG: transcriptional regulator with XRE-family HTH domain [Janthinobacterium sp.]
MESLISKIERGLAMPSLTMLHRLAVSLETNHLAYGYRNIGDGVARILWVNSPAAF